ncbi:SMC-Scp complex subunit ScpB [Streptomyces alkaliterrae]|uniref:SMC-Scp complex subunit ScpB n=1 Tax=Streptomyces alkaliterrae TaxID=2213162 RepID=A0A5P0YVJ4_9ACTN|nr:SMC-Scp complex subunit ScpB [Streptomyces alkaliterrae]MBB1254697.1 SMC-Scp complex subunit ScpB [Streptomyces alkaliterrae]MBB1260366.1 SMC-Scp complex subunit ScpB [Streptomyces alkaliterrae]MQS04315.1 SMC-Scp complex subunit ScpB [Streptomyces alkaliterrae]
MSGSDGSGNGDEQVPAPRLPAQQSAPPPPAGAVAELPLAPALEAVLMVVDEPVPVDHLAKVLQRPRREVADALRVLADDYTRQNRGFELREVAGGWRFYSRPDYAEAVEAFVLDGQQARLTQAALETLAVVAYRQPVSRSRVSAVRGVNCDGVMRTLLQRGLVAEAGTEPETGAILYVTTHYFLERLGLRGLDELPDLAPFLPEADAVEEESQEVVPSFEADSSSGDRRGSAT